MLSCAYLNVWCSHIWNTATLKNAIVEVEKVQMEDNYNDQKVQTPSLQKQVTMWGVFFSLGKKRS